MNYHECRVYWGEKNGLQLGTPREFLHDLVKYHGKVAFLNKYTLEIYLIQHRYVPKMMVWKMHLLSNMTLLI